MYNSKISNENGIPGSQSGVVEHSKACESPAIVFFLKKDSEHHPFTQSRYFLAIQPGSCIQHVYTNTSNASRGDGVS